MKLIELYRTCWACPSQWEGTTADGQRVYIRFRGGELSHGFGGTIGEAVENSWDIPSIQAGDDFDGFMPCSLMLSMTGFEPPPGYERVEE